MKIFARQTKVKNFSLLVFSFSLFTFASPLAIAQEASPSSTDTVRDKVRQTIENLVKKPRAVIGTLDSITDSTLKIKTEDGKVVLVATSDKTSYGKTSNNKQADVKFADLAIGDFTAALGYKNGNDILDAQRVLAYETTPFIKKQTAYGEVTEISRTILTIRHPKTNDSWSVEAAKSTVVSQKSQTNLEAIKQGSRIIVVGVLSTKKDKTIIASKIHIISGKTKGQEEPKRTPRAEAASPSLKPSPKSSPALPPTSQP